MEGSAMTLSIRISMGSERLKAFKARVLGPRLLVPRSYVASPESGIARICYNTQNGIGMICRVRELFSTEPFKLKGGSPRLIDPLGSPCLRNPQRFMI